MPRRRLSPIRRGLLWWFEPPASPWMSLSFAVDFLAARTWLTALNQSTRDGPRVTVQHLLTATIGRLYAEFPEANARVVGRRIYSHPTVGVGAPVNLLGHAGGADRELSMMIVRDVEQKTVLEVAAETSRQVSAEREGDVQDPVGRWLFRLIKWSPDRVMYGSLGALDFVIRRHVVASRMHRYMPCTVGITNPGSAFQGNRGGLFRGASANIPDRLVYVGSLWGFGPIQDEVIAVDGQPVVRPMLPFMFDFDHRLFDGVKAGRIVDRFRGILQDPAAVFGEDGRRV